MSAKCFPGATLLSLLLTSIAAAQAPPATIVAPTPFASGGAPAYAPPPGTVPNSSAEAPLPYPAMAPNATTAPTPPPDPWIAYPQAYCCGPYGGSGPITWEIYLRSGTVSPVGGNAMDRALGTGWEIQVGGRSLFFNQPRDKAWTVDLSVANAFNPGTNHNVPFTNVLGNPEFVYGLNRTFAQLALGREYYLLHPPMCGGGWNWRAGWDVAFRYGTASARAFDTVALGTDRHNSRLFGDAWAIHSDFELPRGCWTYIAGVRLEYSYDWISMFGSHSNFQSINVLYTLGVRF